MTTKYVVPAHRDHSKFNENWEKAHDWRESIRLAHNRDFVFEVAEKSLTADYEGSGQGISSSDINHRVFSIWQSMMDVRESYSSELAFLVDYSWGN